MNSNVLPMDVIPIQGADGSQGDSGPQGERGEIVRTCKFFSFCSVVGNWLTFCKGKVFPHAKFWTYWKCMNSKTCSNFSCFYKLKDLFVKSYLSHW